MDLRLDWNRERYRTRDRLLAYRDLIMPLVPEINISPFYPWNTEAVRGTLSSFPVQGDVNTLYFDYETEILYYFDATNGYTPVRAIPII